MFIFVVVLKHVAERDITKDTLENLKIAAKRIDEALIQHLAYIDISKKAIKNLNVATEQVKDPRKHFIPCDRLYYLLFMLQN